MLDFAKLFFQQLHGLPAALRHTFVALFFTTAICFLIAFKRWLDSRRVSKDSDFWATVPVGLSMSQLALWIVWATCSFYTSYNEAPKPEVQAATSSPAPAPKLGVVAHKPALRKRPEPAAQTAVAPAVKRESAALRSETPAPRAETQATHRTVESTHRNDVAAMPKPDDTVHAVESPVAPKPEATAPRTELAPLQAPPAPETAAQSTPQPSPTSEQAAAPAPAVHQPDVIISGMSHGAEGPPARRRQQQVAN